MTENQTGPDVFGFVDNSFQRQPILGMDAESFGGAQRFSSTARLIAAPVSAR